MTDEVVHYEFHVSKVEQYHRRFACDIDRRIVPAFTSTIHQNDVNCPRCLEFMKRVGILVDTQEPVESLIHVLSRNGETWCHLNVDNGLIRWVFGSMADTATCEVCRLRADSDETPTKGTIVPNQNDAILSVIVLTDLADTENKFLDQLSLSRDSITDEELKSHARFIKNLLGAQSDLNYAMLRQIINIDEEIDKMRQKLSE